MAGCGGSEPTVADNIRLEWMRHGEVTLSFVKAQLPGQDDYFYYQLTSYLNADSRGALQWNEENAIRKEFGDRYNTLIKDFQERSPFYAQFKYLAETATQWCWTKGCEKERRSALETLAYEKWNVFVNVASLSENESRKFLEKALPLLAKPELARNPSLVRAIHGATRFLQGKSISESKSFLQRMVGWIRVGQFGKNLRLLEKSYRPLLWSDDPREREAARKVFSSGELKRMATEVLESPSSTASRQVYALEHLEEVLYFDLEGREKLFQKYKDLVSKEPNDPFLNFAAGFWVYHSKSGLADEETRTYFAKALELEKVKDSNYYYYSARSLQYWNSEEAIADFEKAISLAPQNQEILESFVNILNHYRRTEKALEVYKKLVKLDPGFYFMLGNCYLRLGKKEEAEKAHREALKRRTYTSKEFEAGEREEAEIKKERIEYYQAAVEIYPLGSRSWASLGCAFFDFQRFDEAIQAYETAFRLSAGGYHHLSEIARIYLEQQKYDKVIETFERIKRGGEPNADSHFIVGRAYLALDKREEAIEHLKKALELDPKDDEIRVALQNAGGEVFTEPPPPLPATPDPKPKPPQPKRPRPSNPVEDYWMLKK